MDQVDLVQLGSKLSKDLLKLKFWFIATIIKAYVAIDDARW